MEQKRVAIVKKGEWGSLSQKRGDYDAFVRIIKSRLDPVATVGVFENTKEALDSLQGHGVLIFLTRGIIDEADEIARENPQVFFLPVCQSKEGLRFLASFWYPMWKC